MKASEWTGILCAVVVLLVVGMCVPSLAANGDNHNFSVGQRAGGSDLTSVSKYVKKYEDTSAATCYSGAAWCTKTATSSTKLMHWHNVDTDLTSTEKTRANNYIEYHQSAPSSSNRQSSATITNTCHCWAFGTFAEHIVGPDDETIFDDDYTEVDESDAEVGDLGEHTNNHTSEVSEIEDCEVQKVKSKWSWYGVYETGPSIYGGVDQYWED